MAPKITTEAAVESSTMIGDGVLTCALPHDTMLPILARLPVKSLSRFKCVCKTWRYLFSNPKFAKIHYDLFSVSPKKCSLQAHLLRVPRLGFHPRKKGPGLYGFVIGICRGLVCMSRPLETNEIILWNPVTNMWKSLPLSKTDFGAADFISLGFGCSDEGGEYDYKVVRIFRLKVKKPEMKGEWDEMKVGVEVYSSKSDSWQKIEVPFNFRPRSHCTDAIVNGNPYWVAFVEEITKTSKQRIWSVLWFDSTTMSFKTLPIFMFGFSLEEKAFVDWKGRVGALRGVNRTDGWLNSFEVCVYDDAKRDWVRAAWFDQGIKMQQARSLGCWRTGKIAGGCLDGSNKLFVYDPSKKCVIGEGVVSKQVKGSLKVMPYDESLAFVKGMESMLPMKEELKHQHQHPDENPFFNSNIMDGFFVVSREVACYYLLAV